MSDGIERLLRESHPPAGMLASPIPQYRNPDTGDPEPVEGQNGSPFATLLDADGNPISPATTNKQDDIINAIETLATTLGTETTLAAVLQTLQGTLDVSGNVGVSGSVDVSNRAERELGKVTLTGQIQGLSTDVKPTLGPDDRASFFEWDTETLCYWDGSQWVVTE